MKHIGYLLAFLLMVGQPFRSLAQAKELSYQEGTTQLIGYFAAPAPNKKKAPGIVVIHAWMGITNHEKTTVNRLSNLGYYALAADIYGANVHPANPQEAGKQAGYYKTNYKEYQARINAAIAVLVKQGADPDNIVVIGYCFGGSGAIEAARAGLPVKGIVSFHGGLAKDPTRPNAPLKPKMLILHGADDPHESPAEINAFQQEMRDGKADWQMVYFANAVHSFTDPAAGTDNSKGAAYNKLADERSWKYMLDFLKEVFGNQAPHGTITGKVVNNSTLSTTTLSIS